MTRHYDDRAGLRGHVQFDDYSHTRIFPLGGDRYEWHIMSRMTATDCAVMCSLINTHTHTHTH